MSPQATTRVSTRPPVSEIGLYLAIVVPLGRFGAVSRCLALWASLVAVVVLARRLGLSRPAAAYAGLIFTTLPVVILHGAAILNDLLVGSLLLVAAVFLTSRVMSELAVGRRARARTVDEVRCRPGAYRSSWPSCSRACRATVVAGRR